MFVHKHNGQPPGWRPQVGMEPLNREEVGNLRSELGSEGPSRAMSIAVGGVVRASCHEGLRRLAGRGSPGPQPPQGDRPSGTGGNVV